NYVIKISELALLSIEEDKNSCVAPILEKRRNKRRAKYFYLFININVAITVRYIISTTISNCLLRANQNQKKKKEKKPLYDDTTRYTVR
ncbi:MAG: hypothetical protein ACI90V_013528, partial [Bacillariaceae sp.]